MRKSLMVLHLLRSAAQAPWLRLLTSDPPLKNAFDGARALAVAVTFAWLSRCRRLSKDYERSSAVSGTWIYVSMIQRMLRRLKPA
jgi:transposase